VVYIAKQNKNNTTQKQGLLKKVGKAVVETATRSIKPSNIGEAIGTVLQNTAPLKAKEADQVAEKSADTLSKVITFAKKGIQFALPIVKMLSLNDDEWFSKYKTSGATFAEPLLSTVKEDDGKARSSSQVEHLIHSKTIPALTQISTDFNANYGDQSTSFDTSIMPSVLAYVRNKTNNVLVETTDAYKNALVATIQLYSIYYTLRKYEKLTLNIPLNAPTLPLGVNALAPETYSQAVGIADALEGYLKTTSGAPYHILAYVRWRFGTTFKSDNTGRPALIHYDPFASRTYAYRNLNRTGDNPGTPDPIITWIHNEHETKPYIQSLKDAIGELQTRIMNCGRASADLHTAYKDHQVDYSVNDSIFDAKEYNLRCNLTSPMKVAAGFDKVELVLDSRLDQNAALQAVTCSVSKRMASAFDESGNGSCHYQVAAKMGVYEADGEAIIFPQIDYTLAPDDLFVKESYGIQGPFVVSDVQFILNQADLWNPAQRFGYENYHLDAWSQHSSWLAVAGWMANESWQWVSMWATRLYLCRESTADATTTPLLYVLERRFPNRDDAVACDVAGFKSENNGKTVDFWKAEQSVHPISNHSHILTAAVDSCIIAVQMHNHTTASDIIYDTRSQTTIINDLNPLAYDTAVVNNAQVATIQNMFMRNLFDGESTMKDREPLDAAKENIVDLAKTAA
jgi:hypothetical protein